MKVKKIGIALLAIGALSTLPACKFDQASGEKTSNITESTSAIDDSADLADGTDIDSGSVDDIAPVLSASDFKIKVKIRQKECFGSAGCNVTVRIYPTYVGMEDISGHSYDVTYKLIGDEDCPQINTFTVEDGSASVDSEELVSTPSSSTRIKAKVTDVEES